jgi:AcrR family transcriptional regulator
MPRHSRTGERTGEEGPERRVKRRDGLKRQSELMAAALGLFAEKGYGATSIEDIVAAAGTARGTFYLHFRGKGDLFAMIVEEYLGELEAVLETLDISIDRPRAELETFYREAVRSLADVAAMKSFVKVMLSDAIPETQDRVEAFFERIIRFSAEYIARGQTSGRVVPTLAPVALATAIVGAVRGILLRWTRDREGEFDLVRAVDTVIEVFFRGMLLT